MTRAILLGAGGHGLVVAHLARACGIDVIGVSDPALAGAGPWHGIAVLKNDDAIADHAPEQIVLLNGLGRMPRSNGRWRLQAHWAGLGYHFPALVHPAAWVAPDAVLDAGVQVMAGAIVQPGCRIGAASIVNTRAGVDHDCTLGGDVHIAPGATLCGGVTLGDGVFVGAGATVVQGVTLGPGCIIAAGAVVLRNVAAGAILRPDDRRDRI